MSRFAPSLPWGSSNSPLVHVNVEKGIHLLAFPKWCPVSIACLEKTTGSLATAIHPFRSVKKRSPRSRSSSSSRGFQGAEKKKKKKKMVSGMLEVQLLDAKGLKKMDVFGRMDPYVILQYRSDERKSSVARDQDSNPAWNETFKFRVQYPAQDNQYKLILRIMDKDTFTKDDFVGEATVHLGDVIQVGAESGFSELRPRKYNVVLADRTYCGEIRLGVTFTRKEEHSLEEELGGWKHSGHF